MARPRREDLAALWVDDAITTRQLEQPNPFLSRGVEPRCASGLPADAIAVAEAGSKIHRIRPQRSLRSHEPASNRVAQISAITDRTS